MIRICDVVYVVQLVCATSARFKLALACSVNTVT